MAHYVYAQPISPAIGFVAMSMDRWNGLDPENQAIIADRAKEFGENVWADMANSDQQGFACLAGDTDGGPEC